LSEQTKQTALTLGAKDFLTKPIRLAEVLLRIYNLLETRFFYLELQERNRVLDERVRERTRELQLAHDQMLRHLALAADYRDDLTGLHAQRVGFIAALLAQGIGVPDDEVKLIRGAAPLHDLGKISIERKVVVPPLPPLPPPEPDRPTQLQRIRAALAPEIAAGQASADQTANRIIIRVGNIILFDSGSATVLQQFKPVAARVAAALDKEPGYIQVIGHTDNTPINGTNVRFPSNFQLSIERAKNVAALLKPGLAKPDRLQTDGKGETAPIADNKTPEGRARNRRVEILIPREETLTAEEKNDANSHK